MDQRNNKLSSTIDFKKSGIEELSQMQIEANDVISKGDQDVVILSPTGTGKTFAYLLPLIQKVNVDSDEIQAIVIVPNRELALQSFQVLQGLGTKVRGCACYGGRAAMDEHKILKQILPHIVFATPGRLNDHLNKKNIVSNSIHFVVIDEFDKCLAMGFQEEMSEVLGQLPNIKQRILLSATETKDIPLFVNIQQTYRLDYLDDNLEKKEQITIYKVQSPENDKLSTLGNLLRTFGNQSSIVFVNYRESTDRIHTYLAEQNFFTSVFHGGLDQKQRESALYKFLNASANILISTDLASRGLDIPNVDNIIHYHLPENEDSFTHRIGRTARWENVGNSYFILSPSEQLPLYISSDIPEYKIPQSLPDIMPSKMVTFYIGKGKKDKITKTDVVGFLCKKCGLQSKDIGRIDIFDHYVYVAVSRKHLSQVLKLSVGEKIKGIKTLVEIVE